MRISPRAPLIIAALAALLLSSLSACATPDVGPFATSTAVVESSIGSHFDPILQKATEASALAPDAQKKRELSEQVDKLEQHVQSLRASLAVLTGYSTQLSALAGSGAGGKEAADSLIKSVNDSVLRVGAQKPIASASAADPISSLLGALQSVQANAALHEIVEQTHGPVAEISKTLREILGKTNAFANLVGDFWMEHQPDSFRMSAGARKSLEETISSLQSRKYGEAAAAIEKCKIDSDCDVEGEIAKLRRSQERLDSQIAALKQWRAVYVEDAQKYDALIEEDRRWRDENVARATSYSKLVDAWVADHQALGDYLKSCSKAAGILEPRCRAFSASNITLGFRLAGLAFGAPF